MQFSELKNIQFLDKHINNLFFCCNAPNRAVTLLGARPRLRHAYRWLVVRGNTCRACFPRMLPVRPGVKSHL